MYHTAYLDLKGKSKKGNEKTPPPLLPPTIYGCNRAQLGYVKGTVDVISIVESDLQQYPLDIYRRNIEK